MVKHYNPTIVEDANRIFNFKADTIPANVVDVILPTVAISRYANIVVNAIDAVTGSLTVFTTPSDKDFYLTSIHMSEGGTSTNDGTVVFVSAVIGGATRRLIQHCILQIGHFNNSTITYNTPVKIDRNTSIIIVSSFTTGSGNKACSLTGYTVETTATN